MIRSVVYAVLFLALSAAGIPILAAPPVTVQPEHAEIERFDFAELTIQLDGPAVQNPFTDVAVTAIVRQPDGAESRLEGFCDSADGRVFRLRSLARQLGRHAYEVRVKLPDQEHVVAGAYHVKPSDRPGPVRVDPEHPFHFLREGSGEHWFWNGTTAYQLLAWDDATIKQALDRLADLGVNRIRVALCARTESGARWNEPLVRPTERFKFRLEPWPASRPDNLQNPGYDTTRFNLALFQKADRLMRHARERDVIVSVVFYVDGRDAGVDPFGPAGAGGSAEQRYYRYVVARLSAYANVMWDVTNEWHLFRDEAWVNRMGSLIRAADPNHLLISVHGKDVFPFRTAKWAGFALYQQWDDAGGYRFMLDNRRQQVASGRPFPQINEEYGYEDHYPTGWGDAKVWPARTADTRRRLAWQISMAGCYQTTGERANDVTGAGPDTGGGWINGRGNEQMTMLLGYRHLQSFFTSFPWWRLEPRDDLAGASTLVLAEPGVRYVAYVAAGPASLEVEPATYRASWYNPRTGAREPWGAPLAAAGAWTSPPPPDAGDWALLLETDTATR